ncbi:hypothetical protein, partial [Spartinivicinus marinus]|uniref:hypothetical protein n=1 Tax=Spartinivicinus marinus TaxID=2994442 RepID=UPI001C5CB514
MYTINKVPPKYRGVTKERNFNQYDRLFQSLNQAALTVALKLASKPALLRPCVTCSAIHSLPEPISLIPLPFTVISMIVFPRQPCNSRNILSIDAGFPREYGLL